MTDVDPVTLEVLWSRLREAPMEMDTHLARTAFSSVMKHAKDYSTALFTPDGRLISQGVRAPGHLGSMPFMVKRILDEYFPADGWRPGDVVLTNDPYINSGHLPDLFIFVPAFHEDDLAGFCVVGGHHLDIGGSGPASYSMYAPDVYAEGLQIPPLKLYDAGELNEEVMAIITGNSREPRKIHGDLHAQYGSANVGRELYRSILEEYGPDTVSRYVAEIIDRSERRVRDAIEAVPDGSYAFTTRMDGFEEPLPIRAEVTVDGGEVLVDYEGTADQQPGYAINSVWQYTFSYTMLAIKSVLDPEMPQTEGTVGPITVEAPVGSLLNPRPPVPVSARQLVVDFVVGAVTGALDQAVPGQIPAAGGHPLRHMFQFTDPATGSQQVLFDGHYGGAGAHPDRDGYPAVSGSNNLTNTPVETIEAEYPLRVRQYRLTRDSGGVGEFRGGNGTVREYEFLAPAAVQLVNERFVEGPFGMNGGRSGRPGRAVLDPGTDDERELRSKDHLDVAAGDVLRIYSTGGGGNGDPADRDEAAVRGDVLNGLVSPEQAADSYGVDPA